jgi:F-type H+-transporting ATPase subunit delta
MADRKIARRYAKAFLDVAQEADATDWLLRDVVAFAAVANQNGGELYDALSNPVFKVEERKAVLGAVLAKLESHPLARNLLMLLIEKGRFAELQFIAEAYGDMADERAGRVKVVVETAAPITGGLEAEVRAALERTTGKQVILETRTNPALIGGMVARVGSKVYDASVRSRLDDIRRRLIEAQVPAES